MLWQRRLATPCEIKMQRVNITMEQQQFRTFRQSIVNLSESDHAAPLHGFEILNRPFLGTEFSSVEEFYSFSASHGRSRALDVYTINLGLQRFRDAAFADNFQWKQALVFVNIHLSTLFSDEWLDLMARLPLPVSSVVLELSEREGLDTYSDRDVGLMMRDLQEAGIKVAVDDVGMGYSGLHTLAMVHPDYVKIDRQLVFNIDHDPYRQHMMRSLVEYWTREGVSTIAEGIEREQEAAFFTEIGATFGQGYWFHKPEPVAVRVGVVGAN
ncbi:EAL domain-containing protein [Alicyclobacillus mengziensis]|uniref:EAL domain-containing protein n=1 Tax=Alicyclobacillus mengziensis TaxID=2931921 RepID=A0A9X7Z542_9BACL|nr:EAL domain-containing protein [Alicyclobacillus mengziensis]QSO46564.1 EAL domain-containing protein [Alicyclobacillus mengziensis]